jgi:hypothetical protein
MQLTFNSISYLTFDIYSQQKRILHREKTLAMQDQPQPRRQSRDSEVRHTELPCLRPVVNISPTSII